ncbi:unnamed protein product [marine sediment metagenome]|uniref:Uncharacterized protein n=1 Tax=marine sediment metagenome TaxID=412755 RepID=X0U640_9ZZZZ
MEQVTINGRTWNITKRHSLDFLREHDLTKFADSLEARGFCATLYLKGKRQGSALA